jgi:hypothetical protein
LRVDIGSGLTEQSQLLYSVNSNEPAWVFPSAPAEYGSQQSPYQPFTTLPTPGSQSDSAASGVPLQNIPVNSDLVPVLDQHMPTPESSVLFPDFFDMMNQQFWESEVNYFPGPLGSTAGNPDQLPISLLGKTIGTSEEFVPPNFIDQHTASIAEDSQHNAYANESALSAMIGSISQVEQTAVPPHKSTTYKRSDEPPQNAEGKMICKNIECSDLTFTKRCEWK